MPPTPTPRRSRFYWFLSLKARLTWWHTLVVLITVGAALLALREGLRFYLLQESDVVLNDEAKELLLAIERWYPDREQIIAEMQQKAAGHADRGWHIRWLSPDRKTTLWASSNVPAEQLRYQATNFQDYTIWTSSTQRSIERRLAVNGLPAYFVRVGTPVDFVQNDIDRLTRIAVPVALGIVLLAPLGGYFLSIRAVKPLQEIIQTTARLRPSQLEDRLPVRPVGDELDQLAIRINQFLDEIGDHIRQQQDFVANAAHELRSPLAAILSSVEVTIGKPRTAAEYEDLIALIEEECLHLSNLVNQLMQLAQHELNPQPLDHQPVCVADIIRKAVEMFGPVAEENQLRLEVSELAETNILGDAHQLRQLVSNLLDNAIKFTTAGGRVKVALSDDAERRELVLLIADTGIGIAPQDLDRIFERFYQVDRARSRGVSRRGNGLGLSICAKIVEQHGGTIAIDSQPGSGTSIRVHLPHSSGEQAAASAPSAT